ncbi:Uncharacterised protein [uncultured archaeon]|nr:Uncharacterised protein [uncultured archaeon]
MTKEKDLQLQAIVEELSGIREAMEDISDEISELHQSIMIIGMLKMAEVRPDMKEKLEPIFKEMVSAFEVAGGV